MTKNNFTPHNFLKGNNTHFSKLTKMLASAVVLVSMSTLISCANASGDGDWASGEPDTSQGIPDTETPSPGTTTPTPSPVPTDPADPSIHFSMLPKIAQLAHGPGQTWNGCDKNAMVMGGYGSTTKCGNGTLHPAFAVHLNKHFFGCVEVAARAADMKQPDRVFLTHWGTYVNRNARNSSSLSMHALARAIDIVKFVVYDRDGKSVQISTNVKDFKGNTVKFYNSFRQCWKDTMPSKCRPGQREYSGSIGIPGSALGGNSLHNDHIHLSFPTCAG
ncbi:extensin family protein [Bdellovibrio sp. 22V]|uniref:extensin family protein n=1 Tax=Bdellovibrio TaxID=958 RepID=UPI002542A3A5|nr:extensin family protein [Bdellovibrio sp. 22V]WII72602.1 extensin family protein [Bdellovibrio sp. 22V]